jgi:hypothetical protein
MSVRTPILTMPSVYCASAVLLAKTTASEADANVAAKVLAGVTRFIFVSPWCRVSIARAESAG